MLPVTVVTPAAFSPSASAVSGVAWWSWKRGRSASDWMYSGLASVGSRADHPERTDRTVAGPAVGEEPGLVPEVGPESSDGGDGDEDLLGRGGSERLVGPAEQH